MAIITLNNNSLSSVTSLPAGVGGITNAQQWRITANFNGGVDPISSNWEEVDNKYSRIGSAMSVSSGVWTFPETGVWLIMFHARNSFTGTYAYYEPIINGTQDNSSYNGLAFSTTAGTNSSSSQYRSACAIAVFDVNDTSLCKIKLRIATDGASVTTQGDTTTTLTGVTFIRLGDT